jgi:hypothetical protein
LPELPLIPKFAPEVAVIACELRNRSSDVAGLSRDEDETMKTRRMAYWWFRFVLSGRFFEKFLSLRRARRS